MSEHPRRLDPDLKDQVADFDEDQEPILVDLILHAAVLLDQSTRSRGAHSYSPAEAVEYAAASRDEVQSDLIKTATEVLETVTHQSEAGTDTDDPEDSSKQVTFESLTDPA